MNRQENPNPKHSSLTTTTNRRVQDLPNLTQCQACGYRIDTCNAATTTTTGAGKNHHNNKKIVTLYSEWRIILLCIKCSSLVETSQICSYCFKESNHSDGNCFRCTKCRRSFHRKCFLDQRYVGPWSYSCCGSSSSSSSGEFSVCVDCWLPESIVNNTQLIRKRNSRVLDEAKEGKNVVVETKKRLKSRVGDSKLAIGYRRNRNSNMDTTPSVSETVAGVIRVSNYDSSLNAESTKFGGRVYARKRLNYGNFRENVLTTIQLNAAINMLRPKNFGMGDSNCLNLPRTGESYGSMDKTHLERSVSIGVQDCDSSTKVDCLKLCTKVYSRRRLGKLNLARLVYTRKKVEFKHLEKYDRQTTVINHLVKVEEETYSTKLISSTVDDDNCVDFGLRPYYSHSRAVDKTCDGGKHDRYLLKYRKRKLG